MAGCQEIKNLPHWAVFESGGAGDGTRTRDSLLGRQAQHCLLLDLLTKQEVFHYNSFKLLRNKYLRPVKSVT